MFKTNYLDLLIQDELLRFVKQNGVEAIKQSSTKDFVNGNVVIKVPMNRKSITDLLSGARNIHKDLGEYRSDIMNSFSSFSQNNGHSRMSYENLFMDTTKRIIKIDTEMTFEQSLNMAIKFRNKLGSKFYGCLLKVKGMDSTLINPFHILTSLSAVSEYGLNKQGVMDVSKYKFYPIIYILDNEMQLDLEHHSVFADMEKIETNINCLMQIFGSKTQSKTKITGTNLDNLDEEKLNKIRKGEMNIEIKYKQTIEDSDDEDESNDSNNYVIAHQLMANGVVAPFYGASIVKIKKNLSDSKGTRLTPMPTVNIAGAVDNFESVIFDNVCTGSTFKNTTLDGLRTQTHVNYGSPYGSSKTFMPGSLVYARRMIEKSLQVYRTVKLFDIEEPEDVSIDYDNLLNEISKYALHETGCKYGNPAIGTYDELR